VPQSIGEEESRITLIAVETARVIFSIGHSNHSFEKFAELLTQHGIDVVVDVRSRPYSRFAVQFNGPVLETALEDCGIRYVSLGSELGGWPASVLYYDDEGRVRYSELEKSDDFRRGIERLLHESESARLALMCSEEDPASCHRWRLIGRVLAARGVSMQHIRGDGSLQTNEDVDRADAQKHPKRYQTRYQLSLFGGEEGFGKSSRRVHLPKSRDPDRSAQ
jgi:uncharacterized protein (DUF488 family)